MSRYFFNIEDGKCLIDEDGTELPDLAAVRAVAARTMSEILRDCSEQPDLQAGLAMHVLDEAGGEVVTIRVTMDDPTHAELTPILINEVVEIHNADSVGGITIEDSGDQHEDQHAPLHS